MQNTEKKSKPAKHKNSKIENAKRTKAKGNPNKSRQKVESSNPARWDWGKIMRFRVRKSYYETNRNKPGKGRGIKTASRKAGDNNSPLPRKQLPYDSRIDDKGPLTVKKSQPNKRDINSKTTQVEISGISIFRPDALLTRKKKDKPRKEYSDKRLFTSKRGNDPDKLNNDRLMTANSEKKRAKDFDQDRLETVRKDKKLSNMDSDKLLTIKQKDSKREAFDQSKLETYRKKNEPAKMDDRLMTIEVKDNKRKPFDQSKLETYKVNKKKYTEMDDRLMTIKVSDKNRKPFDDDKLMTIKVSKKDRRPFDDDKLMTVKRRDDKPESLHDKRLLTVKERGSKSKEMSKSAEEIADYEGTYKLNTKKGKGYHPSSRHLNADRHGMPWLKKRQQDLSMFWSIIWPWDLQPKAVKEKKPKLRRDKNEGQIWDNSVHPDSWKKTPEAAESGEEQ